MSEPTAPHIGLIRRLLGEGNERVHAAVILVSCVTLCACALVLAGAAAAGRTVSVEFAAAVGAVSGLAGWAYGKAKQVGAAAPPATENGAVSERPAMEGSAKIEAQP